MFIKPARWALTLTNPPVQLRGLALLSLGLLLVNLFYHGQQPYAVNLIPPPFDKLAHLSLFATIGILLWLATGARRVALVLLLSILLGALDELIQSASPGRSADWFDLLADTVGALLGVYVCRWLGRWLAGSVGVRVMQDQPNGSHDDS